MIEAIRLDILDVLDKVIKILEIKEEKDLVEIKELSNHTIHSASIFQDNDSVSIAVVVYALYKIIERGVDYESKIYTKILSHLRKTKQYLYKKDFTRYQAMIRGMLKEISGIDRKLKIYIMDVIEKARIKKGSKIYEHGVSIARAAEILGISQWELMSYVGKTEIVEEVPKVTSLRNRLGLVRRLFKI